MIITISHQKGGVGKSTIAFNMATLLQKKYKIEIVDLDVQNTITHTNNIRSNNKLKKLDIYYLKNEKEFNKFIEKDSDDKVIIIDSGGFDSSLNRLAIFYSDIIVTPVSDRFNEISGLMKYKEILKELKQLSNEEIKVHVLINNINPQVKNFMGLKSFIEQNEEFVLMKSILRQRADYDKSAWQGKNIKEFNKDSKATQEFKEFIKEIKNKIGL